MASRSPRTSRTGAVESVSAREVQRRGQGRDSVAARLDRIERVAGGWTLTVMRYRIFAPDKVELEADDPLQSYALIPRRSPLLDPAQLRVRDDDDDLGTGYELAAGLFVRAQIEWKGRFEDEYDFNRGRPRGAAGRRQGVRVVHEGGLRRAPGGNVQPRNFISERSWRSPELPAG